MDELECFRKAAELGCPDFRLGHYCFLAPDPESEHPYTIKLPDDDPRMNRVAAAVCAEWWSTKDGVEVQSMSLQRKYEKERMEMIEQARAFGKKYGAAQ